MSKKTILTLSLILNVALVIFFVAKRIYFSHSSGNQPLYSDQWNRARQSTLAHLPIDTSDIVFVGNSITEGFRVEEIFHSLHVKNRGIGGNQSHHIIGRILDIARAKPKKIFLDIGINDILANVPADTIFANYKTIIETIRRKSPSTEIIIQSVFPIGISHREQEAAIEEFNIRLSNYCANQGIVFIDIFSGLCRNGLLDPAFTFDDVHLNGAGYAIWKSKIDGLVN